MINETEYRKQAMQIWKSGHEQNKETLQPDLKTQLTRIFALKKNMVQSISFLFTNKRQPYK